MRYWQVSFQDGLQVLLHAIDALQAIQRLATLDVLADRDYKDIVAVEERTPATIERPPRQSPRPDHSNHLH